MLHLNIIDSVCGSRKNVDRLCLAYGICRSGPFGLYVPSNSTLSAAEINWSRKVHFRNHGGWSLSQGAETSHITKSLKAGQTLEIRFSKLAQTYQIYLRIEILIGLGEKRRGQGKSPKKKIFERSLYRM